MKLRPALLACCLLPAMSSAHEFDFTDEIAIAAPPHAIWNAITRPEHVKLYHFAPLHEIELKTGGRIRYGTDTRTMISGTITAFEAPSKLIHTFRFGGPGTKNDPETSVTYEIRGAEKGSILKVTHTGFTADNQTRADVTGGWPLILKRMKASIEQGKAP